MLAWLELLMVVLTMGQPHSDPLRLSKRSPMDLRLSKRPVLDTSLEYVSGEEDVDYSTEGALADLLHEDKRNMLRLSKRDILRLSKRDLLRLSKRNILRLSKRDILRLSKRDLLRLSKRAEDEVTIQSLDTWLLS